MWLLFSVKIDQLITIIQDCMTADIALQLLFLYHRECKLDCFIDESTRVCLQPIRGVDGSDYINANFIDVIITYMTSLKLQ